MSASFPVTAVRGREAPVRSGAFSLDLCVPVMVQWTKSSDWRCIMPRTEAQKRARKAYDKKCRKLTIVIYPHERDMIEKIDSVDSYRAYIKALIRADMEKG